MEGSSGSGSDWYNTTGNSTVIPFDSGGFAVGVAVTMGTLIALMVFIMLVLSDSLASFYAWIMPYMTLQWLKPKSDSFLMTLFNQPGDDEDDNPFEEPMLPVGDQFRDDADVVVLPVPVDIPMEEMRHGARSTDTDDATAALSDNSNWPAIPGGTKRD